MLNLVATAPGVADVAVSASAPAGFGIEPRSSSVGIRSNGLPRTGEVPLAVTVPAGTPEGEYPIEVRARMSGADPIVRTASVLVRSGHCAGETVSFCPVDLGRDYNHDGVATLENPDQGNFDGGGWSYAANLLPAPGPVTLSGVPYEAPSTSGDDPDFVESRGQAVVLPTGHFQTAHVLGATHHGNVDTTATIGYDDGSRATVPLRLTDWAGQPAFGNTAEIQMPYRLRAGQGQDGPPVAIFRTDLPLEGGKIVRSITLPGDERVELYAVTLRKE
jgi:hypothetical protein